MSEQQQGTPDGPEFAGILADPMAVWLRGLEAAPAGDAVGELLGCPVVTVDYDPWRLHRGPECDTPTVVTDPS